MGSLPHVPMEPEPTHETTATITDPLPLAQRTHTMRTRAIDGIFKPKMFLATKHPLPKVFQTALVPSEPTCNSQAVKSLEWRAATPLEIDALHRQGIWT